MCQEAVPFSGTLCEDCWRTIGQQALFEWDEAEQGYVLLPEYRRAV